MSDEREKRLDKLLLDSQQLIEVLSKELLNQKEEVAFSMAVRDDERFYSMKETAGLLHEYVLQNTGLNVGRNKLFSYLRDMDILSSTESYWNEPYQRFIDSGHFEIKLKDTPAGMKNVTLVTGKGLKYIQQKIVEYLG